MPCTLGFRQSPDGDVDPLLQVLSKAVFWGMLHFHHNVHRAPFDSVIPDTDNSTSFQLQAKGFIGQKLTSTGIHHQSAAQSEEFTYSFYVLVDREVWQNEGLLIAHLQVKDSVKALGEAFNITGDNVPSSEAEGSGWQETLCKAKAPSFPCKMYSMCIAEDVRKMFTIPDVLAKVMDSLRGDDMYNQLWLCVKLEYMSTFKDIVKRQRELKGNEKKGHHIEIFTIVNDPGWENEGVSLEWMRTAKELDAYVLRQENMEEFYRSYHLGIISWEEVDRDSL
ncbi:MAG: hypothetical protein M1827_001898 [Pycnora praestabilis]|nr:MAG: hypothetical protein M1827_001898 [Pycnora praestabilis]